jgi:DNA-binding transcriptional LysR family regulator
MRQMAVRPDYLGLEAFVAVAERGSFHKAAAHLGITQTALSHRMRKLEDYLGITLLQRTTRHVALTPAGLDLLPRAQALLAQAHAVFTDLAHAASHRQERIAIGCLPTLAIHVLPRALAKFGLQHPGTQVRVFDNSASQIAERVQSGEAEFGLTVLATDRWDLDIRPLAREAYGVVCRTDHALAGRAFVRWSELAAHRLIRISAQTGHRLLIDDALGAASEHMTWSHEVQHVATAVALVAAGVGVTVVPQSAVDLVPAGTLACIALRHPAVTRTIGVVTRRGVPMTPIAANLLAILQSQLGRSEIARGRKTRRTVSHS